MKNKIYWVIYFVLIAVQIYGILHSDLYNNKGIEIYDIIWNRFTTVLFFLSSLYILTYTRDLIDNYKITDIVIDKIIIISAMIIPLLFVFVCVFTWMTAMYFLKYF